VGVEMIFPTSARIVFQRNPLAEVVCQVTFPRNLELWERAPIELQQALRANYPMLDIEEQVSFQWPSGPEVQPARRGITIYHFSPSDRSARLTITSDFCAVSTAQYANWQTFRTRLSDLLSAYCKIYEPAAFLRIGLRYINKLNLHALNLVGRSP